MSRVELGEWIGEKGHFKLDLQTFLVSRGLITANSGAGKSYLIRKFLEETQGKIQQIVLDVEGEFATLREKYDYILAGPGADVDATPETAEILARKVLELGSSIIIDLYELPHEERIEFVSKFFNAMVNAPKALWHPVLVVLDEAHVFAPEKAKSESRRAVADMATRGRKRGFCLTLATQRLAKLHKDVAAECNNKMIGRMSLDIDMKRAAEELGLSNKADILALRELDPGQFFVFGPAISKTVRKAKIGKVETKHIEPGQVLKDRIPVPTKKMLSILAKLTDLPKQAKQEQEDMESLRAQVRTLEHELRVLKKEGLSIKDLNELKELRKTMATISKQKKVILDSIDYLRAQVQLLPEAQAPAPAQGHVLTIMGPLPTHVLPPLPSVRKIESSQQDLDPQGSPLGRCERAILKFLAARPDRWFNQSQIGTWSGYSKKSSGFQNALSRLATGGWIVREHGKIALASGREEQARQVLGRDFEAPATTLEDWRGKLGKCQRAVFDVLLSSPAHVWGKEEIAKQAGYSAGSSGFHNALSDLTTLGLMKRSHGGVQLNPEVMDV